MVYSFVDALRWATQLAEGLAYLHACRPLIIHRDLKPENCLLTGQCRAAVCRNASHTLQGRPICKGLTKTAISCFCESVLK